MDKNRKLATQNQVKYANAISEQLGLGITFSCKDSYFDVSWFIMTNEANYKNSNHCKPASIRQIDYANAIAITCGMNIVFDESSTNDEIREFIERNKEEYDYIVKRKEILEYCKQDKKFETKTALYICDNLFKKSGLYCFLGNNDEILYIGKSVDLSRRIFSSYRERNKQAEIKRILYLVNDNMADVNILEILLICENNPILNTESKTSCAPELFNSNIDIIKDFKEIPL